MSTEVEHAHAFRRDTTGLCRCGMTAEQYQRLLDDEATGRPHAAETTKPIDQHGRAVDEQPEIVGQIVITWPKPVGGFPGVLVSNQVAITNADTGQPILTLTEFTTFNVHAEAGYLVVAELVTLADADGRPILDSTEINERMAVADNGDIATTTSRWRVAEMRIAE